MLNAQESNFSIMIFSKIVWLYLPISAYRQAKQIINIVSVNKKNSRLIPVRNQTGVSYAPENRQLTVDKSFISLSLLSQHFGAFRSFLLGCIPPSQSGQYNGPIQRSIERVDRDTRAERFVQAFRGRKKDLQSP